MHTFKKSLIYTALAGALAMTSSTVLADDDAKAKDENIEIITVTSRKRQESIIQVPMSVSSISALEIADRNLLNKEDIYRTLAGAANPRGQLILRGLSGGNSAAPNTTSSFTDDIPFDFGDMFDVEAVEVLRGPQGTLWGSNAIGGTVRVITRKPVMNEFEVATSVQAMQTENVDGTDLRAWAAINIPLIDNTLAMRLTGHGSYKPGAIVNTNTGVQRHRRDEYVRSQFLFQPTEDMSFNLGLWRIQNYRIGTTSADLSKPSFRRIAGATPNEDSDWGYDISYSRQDCTTGQSRSECFGANKSTTTGEKYTVWESLDGWSQNQTDLVTLSAEFEDLFDIATLTYAGSYRNSTSNSLDNWSRLDMDDMVKTWIINDTESSRVTHELRLQSANLDSPLSWTLGAFYDKNWIGYNPNRQWQYHENDPISIAVFSDWNDWAWGSGWAAQGVTNVGELGEVVYSDNSKNYNLTYNSIWDREFAVFGEASYVFETDNMGRFEITAGLRYYDLKDFSDTVQSGIWIGSTPNQSISKGEETGNRKKLSLSWMPDSNQAVYALYAEGYRPGGNNGPLPNSCLDDEFAGAKTDRYTSDTIQNYELGYKANLKNRFQFSAAVYQIDWNDVIVAVYMPSCGFTYTGNAAKARSKGVEWESKLRVTDDLDLLFNASYTDAKLLNDVPSLQAEAGQNMTMVPKYNAYIGLDQAVELFNRQAFVRVDVEAYGEYKSHFNAREDGFDTSDAYTRVNFSGRIDLNDNTKLSLYVKNIFNTEVEEYKRARSRGTNTSNFLTVDYGTERSITLRLDYTFF